MGGEPARTENRSRPSTISIVDGKYSLRDRFAPVAPSRRRVAHVGSPKSVSFAVPGHQGDHEE